MAGVVALVARRARQAVFWSTVAGLIGSLGGLAYLRYITWKRLYVRRLVCFWWQLGPIVLHYRWALRAAGGDEEREKRVKQLHARYAPVVRRIIGELRGMYTKVAQVASIAPNLLPMEYKREFQSLQNDTTPAAWLAIRGVIEDDLGAPIGQLFERFEREPLGCASIGQVHLATWRGRQIVLKVQYPEAAVNLMADFDCIEAAARLNKMDTEGVALKMTQKCRKQFEQELDYSQEASHLQSLHECISAAPEFHGKVFVPAPIPQLTRGRVLAMDYVPGPKLADIFIARLQAVGMDGLANTLKSVMEATGETTPVSSGGADEMAGAENAGAKSSASAAGVAASVADAVGGAKAGEVPAAHRTFAWLSKYLGPQGAMIVMKIKAELKFCWLRCRGRLAPGSSTRELHQKLHLVVHLQGFQFFFCPVFNGDPHPGNFLAVPDGRVGIIDLGQCVKFDHKVKLGFANLMLALVLPETPESNALVADIIASMGVRSARGDKEFLAFMCRFMLTSFRPEWATGWATYMFSRDSVVEQPIEVFFVTRISALLRGFGLFMSENVDVSRAWAPWAERWLRENGEPTYPRPVAPDRK